VPCPSRKRGARSGESRSAASLNGQMSKFSGIICRRFSKPKKRLIKGMVCGIQSSKDLKLSNIAITLKQTQSLLNTVDQLSKNLDDEDLTEGINEKICLGPPK
jgi:hypothetical protein